MVQYGPNGDKKKCWECGWLQGFEHLTTAHTVYV